MKESFTSSEYTPSHPFAVRDGMSPFGRILERCFDMFLAFVSMIVFSPLFVIIFLAIKCSGGPAIYRQERIGRNGKPFYIYKFRSMKVNAEPAGPELCHENLKDDLRLTKTGRLLRAHHLDELPQLWNVLIGDMAFVGPRPERKFYIDQIMALDPRYESLYQVRPGVTSNATLYNGYTDTMEKMLKRLEMDLDYMETRSCGKNLKILTKTFLSILFGSKF